jgi:hypothetical protein
VWNRSIRYTYIYTVLAQLSLANNIGSVGFHEIYVRLREERTERQRLACCAVLGDGSNGDGPMWYLLLWWGPPPLTLVVHPEWELIAPRRHRDCLPDRRTSAS